ncbi:MAG: diguanylate cyclase [Burkholderiaceae bacterium]|nr:MAG: diguanylate cyclase [Burkholderiaceae bacterium]MBE7426351.1 diguanylate cyclase [Ideonella sp.]MCC7286267.1 diguanylate cyclase [Burkholderiaceae bacterium]
MSATASTPSAAPAQIAKGALRRLAAQQLEPTPEHYARAYAQEAGQPPPEDAGPAWAALIERLVRGLERGGRHWTGARKKHSVQRVLDGSRADGQRLQQRLTQLLAAWDGDRPAGEVEISGLAPLDAAGEPAAETPGIAAERTDRDGADWQPLLHEVRATLAAALPRERPDAATLADALAAAAQRLAAEGPHAALLDEVARLGEQARAHLSHRHLLLDELLQLCRAMTESLGELAEDQSWARGQCDALRERLGESPSVRGVHAAAELLATTRARQHELRREREQARDALKAMMQHMLGELAELGQHTGRFNDNVQRYAQTIERADSLQGLAGVVQEMVTETRAVHQVVDGARQRLSREHERASELEQRVRQLEGELRRLSDEVSTDALTQVANRRGLLQAFDAERARAQRDGAVLSVGLIDIDNFKRLNDSLGHAAGDAALKALAAQVRQSLRPTDHLARFGGEEFVVLLPGTVRDEAQALLARLQRALSASLFMHEGREVFVTFSAGVTALRDGEALDSALERADRALYEAKHTGKNRTCVG